MSSIHIPSIPDHDANERSVDNSQLLVAHTYADAANIFLVPMSKQIAMKFPEMAETVLRAPLGGQNVGSASSNVSPGSSRIVHTANDTIAPAEVPAKPKTKVRVHTADAPDWAVAPDTCHDDLSKSGTGKEKDDAKASASGNGDRRNIRRKNDVQSSGPAAVREGATRRRSRRTRRRRGETGVLHAGKGNEVAVVGEPSITSDQKQDEPWVMKKHDPIPASITPNVTLIKQERIISSPLTAYGGPFLGSALGRDSYSIAGERAQSTKKDLPALQVNVPTIAQARLLHDFGCSTSVSNLWEMGTDDLSSAHANNSVRPTSALSDDPWSRPFQVKFPAQMHELGGQHRDLGRRTTPNVVVSNAPCLGPFSFPALHSQIPQSKCDDMIDLTALRPRSAASAFPAVNGSGNRLVDPRSWSPAPFSSSTPFPVGPARALPATAQNGTSTSSLHVPHNVGAGRLEQASKYRDSFPDLVHTHAPERPPYDLAHISLSASSMKRESPMDLCAMPRPTSVTHSSSPPHPHPFGTSSMQQQLTQQQPLSAHRVPFCSSPRPFDDLMVNQVLCHARSSVGPSPEPMAAPLDLNLDSLTLD
ncbi:hypothetical protein FISHEDRAFT_58368 [Fistulina hepatica ATCC 64428]|nr:hypothetical protein FISHEDRAFT_58368 [Fistulina hepatica ATCC 64428]